MRRTFIMLMLLSFALGVFAQVSKKESYQLRVESVKLGQFTTLCNYRFSVNLVPSGQAAMFFSKNAEANLSGNPQAMSRAGSLENRLKQASPKLLKLREYMLSHCPRLTQIGILKDSPNTISIGVTTGSDRGSQTILAVEAELLKTVKELWKISVKPKDITRAPLKTAG